MILIRERVLLSSTAKVAGITGGREINGDRLEFLSNQIKGDRLQISCEETWESVAMCLLYKLFHWSEERFIQPYIEGNGLVYHDALQHVVHLHFNPEWKEASVFGLADILV